MKYLIKTNRLNNCKAGDILEEDKVSFNFECLVENNEAEKYYNKIRKFKVGIKTKEQINNNKNTASDRIRGRMVVNNSKNIEIYRPDTEYEVVIFHQADPVGLFIHKGLKILDICDYEWRDKDDDAFFSFIKRMDILIVASKGLKDRLIEDGIKKRIIVIGDGHNIKNRLKKEHKEIAKKAVWFGYIENFPCVVPLLETLKDNNISLRIIAQRDNFRADEFIKWDINTVDKYINECDFAILPKNGKYKTNNKEVTSWLCGIPVARTKEDIIKFKSKQVRQAQLKQVDFSRYDIKDRVKEYTNVCSELINKNL